MEILFNCGSQKVELQASRTDQPLGRRECPASSWATIGKGSVREEADEFLVEAETEGASVKELNRTLLAALRKVEKRTTLRAEWSSGDATERYFDYVLKKTCGWELDEALIHVNHCRPCFPIEDAIRNARWQPTLDENSHP
jgi:hypothetical protein